jgi:hypothetical protein
MADLPINLNSNFIVFVDRLGPLATGRTLSARLRLAEITAVTSMPAIDRDAPAWLITE